MRPRAPKPLQTHTSERRGRLGEDEPPPPKHQSLYPSTCSLLIEGVAMYRSTEGAASGPATCIALNHGAGPLRFMRCRPEGRGGEGRG